MDKMKEIGKSLALWLTIALLIILSFNFLNSEQLKSHTEPFSTFIQQVEKGEIEKVVIRGQRVVGVTKNNEPIETYLPSGYNNIIDELTDEGVEIHVKPE